MCVSCLHAGIPQSLAGTLNAGILACLSHQLCSNRYDEINVAVEANLRKQAEVMHGIDANMQAFGDILQQNASSQQVTSAELCRTVDCNPMLLMID